jgi:hypothetical protein
VKLTQPDYGYEELFFLNHEANLSDIFQLTVERGNKLNHNWVGCGHDFPFGLRLNQPRLNLSIQV